MVVKNVRRFTGYSDEYLNLWKIPSGVQIRRGCKYCLQSKFTSEQQSALLLNSCIIMRQEIDNDSAKKIKFFSVIHLR